MRRLDRGRVAVPPPLRDGDDTTPAPRLAWYRDLYKTDGKTIKDRWNERDVALDEESSTRRALAELSGQLCAYCEKRLERSWQVDHFLPQAEFPWLSYCWDNLLPTCPGCNSRKRAFVPLPLPQAMLVDPVLAAERPGAQPFRKAELLPTLGDRLVDPSFDDPAEHLRFIPEVPAWEGTTRIGQRTVQRLFVDKSHAIHWQQLSETVCVLLKHRSPDEVVEAIVTLSGCPTVFRACVAYWREMLAPVLSAPASDPAPAADPTSSA